MEKFIRAREVMVGEEEGQEGSRLRGKCIHQDEAIAYLGKRDI